MKADLSPGRSCSDLTVQEWDSLLTSLPAALSMMRWLFCRSTLKVCRSLLLMPSITVAGSRSNFSTRSSSASTRANYSRGIIMLLARNVVHSHMVALSEKLALWRPAV